ncbi:RB1-inducible coiled-coil protein 1 isoform X2 [Plodia interpunctella]|uniref:RB1-inducible coiled-coil protein 1 isoform X2 n=1 Tax=Plodia interpunctella TaxID=58824 RepID=UPI002367C447|nr:RB1-inducible coiled-coil protein 1 isoform X2 [Plodia interpunctella]
MLYVFHVDAGQMTTYDMSLTLQTVATLKAAIERKTKTPSSSLVLLVSGGEVLHPDHMVSSYSAGTDTNPIYMFSKPSVKESHLKQSMCSDLSPILELESGEFRSGDRTFDGKSVADLKASVEKCCSMAPTVSTVISCATLAQKFSDLAHELSRSCEQLVHEQHLQHQGWAAVVANLEDIFNEFCDRSRNFKESFKKHRAKKEEYHEQLNALNEVLEALGKIPILPALQVNAEAHRFSGFDVFEETDFEGNLYRVSHPLDNSSETKRCQDFGVEAFKLSEEDVFEQKAPPTNKDVAEMQADDRPIEESDEGIRFGPYSSYESKEELTLLHWILAQGNKASLQDILDYCQKGLTLIDTEPLKEREEELCHILEYANLHGLKQIKGIEDRLYGLDQLLNDVRKREKDQHDQAASLIQYRERLNTACDPSVLPTLVQSHRCQLEKLLKGHQAIVDIRRRITKSKDELSYILKSRLEAVLMIENSMSVQDAHAMLSFQCFNRLARYFGIVAQLHRAPAVFVHAVHEVARRRTFSEAHLKWAADLASKLLKIHEEEISRRQEFNKLFEGHFLKSLFPGMTDLPPPFATQAPSVFDAKLPKLTETDVEFISNSFPQLTEEVPKYDMEATVKFFQQRLSTGDEENKDEIAQTDTEAETESKAVDIDPPRPPIQTVDTSMTCVPVTAAATTLTEVRLTVIREELEPTTLESTSVEHKTVEHEFEPAQFYIEESLPSSLEWGRLGQDNMDTHKINIEKLQEFLINLCGLCRTNILFIRGELANLKNEIDEQKKFVKGKYLEILEAWNKSNEEAAIRFREHTQRMTVDHELELSDMKAAMKEKEDIIDSIKSEKEDLKLEHQMDIEKLNKEHQETKDLLEKTRQEMKELEKKLAEYDANKQVEIKELQEKMHLDYKAEIESLRSRFRLVAITNMDRSPSESSLEKIERTDVIEIASHNAIVMQTKENAEVEKEEAIKKTAAVYEAYWKAKAEEEITAFKTKVENEKQAANENTRRLIAEKDRQINELNNCERTLMLQCHKYKETIQQLTDPETNDYDALLKTQLASLENDKAVLQQQLADLKKELEKRDEAEKSRGSDSERRSSPATEERPLSRCHTPVGLACGTLSLAACMPGHTVLIMWDPAHHNYTVLQEAPIMYFVYSDCLPALDLSLNVKKESDRKLYAVATVESKEYCYAKRNMNRYNMPCGSRFYRVHVKPLRAQPPPSCCNHKHKPDLQKSVDTSQSTGSTTDDAAKSTEVATATLINLESPKSPVEPSQSSVSAVTVPTSEDQLDSIETNDPDWSARMQASTASAMTDMECSVGRCLGPEPVELRVAAGAGAGAGAGAAAGAELAEEAAP